MPDTGQPVFRRKIVGERVLLMLPLHVVLAARVQGSVDPRAVAMALDRLRSRHPLLAVRFDIPTSYGALELESVHGPLT